MPEARFATVRSQFPVRPLVGVMGGSSAAGCKARNDDALAGRIPESRYEMHAKGIVACIADGISGGANSDRAAQTAVLQFATDYYAAPESWPVRDCASRLLGALNAWFHAQNRSGSALAEGQVTTFTALIARSTTAHVVHIGDTRCLRLRGGAITQLTEDHSAAFMGQPASLTRCLGVEPQIRVDYLQEPLEEGDLFALLTDGIHGVLPPARIAALLDEHAPRDQAQLEAAARALCDAALEAGSDDNVSALLLRIVELPSETLTEAHRRLTDQAIPPVMGPGNRIDGYEVERVLHSSTRSHVYLVRGEDGRRLVLKAPSRNFAEDMHYLEGFTLEQWVGRRIDNPQVMKILPHDDSRFLYYLAEWVEGPTLRDWMNAHPAPAPDEVVAVLGSLISAVRIFHRLGMVHRDLKPENVILDDSGTARIIDFGAVQVNGFADLVSGHAPAAPEGSLDYIAPEVLAGRGASNLSDLFAIAAIAYEMLAGQLPFAFADRASLPAHPGDWQPRPLAERRPDLGPAVEAALRRGLAHDPAARPPAMSDFLADLKSALRQRQQAEAKPPLLERGSRRFWRGWALASSATTLALLVALLVQALKGG